MALGPGTVRITAQGHITPTAQSIRVYNVDYVSSTTNTALYLCDDDGKEASDTSTALPIIPVYAEGNGVAGAGHWHSDTGKRFDNGVLVLTSTSFSFATVTFVTEN